MIQPIPVTQGHSVRSFDGRSHGGSIALTETRHPRGMVLARHAHAHACINFVLSGVYDERISGIGEHHGPLGLVFKPALAEHANRFERGGARCLLIELTDRALVDPALDLSEPRESRDPRASRVALALWHELARPEPGGTLAIDELAQELYTLVLARAGRRPVPRSPGVRAATALLHDDPAAPWTLATLAAEVRLHPAHLARAFRARHGTTIGRYQRALRVSEAARRLALTNQSIAELAHVLGFADQSHLTRIFGQAMGVTPAAYRRVLNRG